jgi:hypothetical protein
MNVTQAAEAPEYVPVRLFFIRCQRLQGLKRRASEALRISLWTLVPGAHTAGDASGRERHPGG